MTDFIDETIEEETGVTSRRAFEVHGRKFTALRKDPFGFWTVHTETGRLPSVFSGQFTSYQEIEKIMGNYKPSSGDDSNKGFKKAS